MRGKTVLVAEAGRSGVVAPSDLSSLVEGSLNVLGALQCSTGALRTVRAPVWLAGAGARVAADSAGVFFAAVARDTRVTKGQVVGHTTDFLGRPTGDIRAPIDGLVTFIRGVPSMAKGATLVTIIPIVKEPAPWAAPNEPAFKRMRDISRRDFLAQSGSCAAHLALAARRHASHGANALGGEHAGRRRRARAVRQPREGQRRRVGADLDAAQRRRDDGFEWRNHRRAERRCWRSRDSTSRRAPPGSPAKRASSRAAGRRTSPLTHYHADHANGVAGYLTDADHPTVRSTAAHARPRRRTESAGRRVAHRGRERRRPPLGRPTRRRSTSADAPCASCRAAGHTDSDVSLELDDPSIVFCGDLFWNAMFPNFVDAVPTKFSASVRALRRTRDTTYIPGHGAIGKAAEYDRYVAMLDELERGGAEGLRGGNAGGGRRRRVHAAASLGEWALFNKSFFPRAFDAWYKVLD